MIPYPAALIRAASAALLVVLLHPYRAFADANGTAILFAMVGAGLVLRKYRRFLCVDSAPLINHPAQAEVRLGQEAGCRRVKMDCRHAHRRKTIRPMRLYRRPGIGNRLCPIASSNRRLAWPKSSVLRFSQFSLPATKNLP